MDAVSEPGAAAVRVAPRTPPPSTSALEVEAVHFAYSPRRGRRQADRTKRASAPAERPALAGVSFAVPAGQSIALLGPNGSGKSTLFKVICSRLRPDRGRIRSFGVENPREIRRHIGVVFQRPALDPHLSVFENLRDAALLYGLPRRETVPHVDAELKRAALIDRRDDRVGTLSGGLARRVDLVRALLHRPPLLLLDEPTVGLDPVARVDFLNRLDALRAEREVTVLLSTHLTVEAHRCDRVILLHEGRVVADDQPAALERAQGRRRLLVHDPDWSPPPAEPNWERLPGALGWMRPLSASADEMTTLEPLLRAEDLAFSIVPPSLDDVFRALTGRDLDASGSASASSSSLSLGHVATEEAR